MMRLRATSQSANRRNAVRLFGLTVIVLLSIAQFVSAQSALRSQPMTGKALTGDRFKLEPLDEGDGAFRGLRRNNVAARIQGIVQNHVGVLVPNAGVVLIRSLRDGKVIGQSSVDSLAKFAVTGVEPGFYVAELIGSAGGILATSHAFSAAVGDVIQLAPVIRRASTGLASLLGNATSKAINAAASAGVLAVSSGVPISPQGPGLDD